MLQERAADQTAYTAHARSYGALEAAPASPFRAVGPPQLKGLQPRPREAKGQLTINLLPVVYDDEKEGEGDERAENASAPQLQRTPAQPRQFLPPLPPSRADVSGFEGVSVTERRSPEDAPREDVPVPRGAAAVAGARGASVAPPAIGGSERQVKHTSVSLAQLIGSKEVGRAEDALVSKGPPPPGNSTCRVPRQAARGGVSPAPPPQLQQAASIGKARRPSPPRSSPGRPGASSPGRPAPTRLHEMLQPSVPLRSNRAQEVRLAANKVST
jgi:hypothetical protein